MLDNEQQEAFTRLWTETQPTVSRYVCSVVRDDSTTKDIVQSAALVMLRKFPDYDAGKPFLPWALGVAKFQILGHQRDQARSLVRFDSDLLDDYTRTWAEVTPAISDESAALRNCLKKVSGRSRDVVRLRYYDELNSKEIASQLQLSAANVRVILQRVREQLRDCVQRTMEDAS